MNLRQTLYAWRDNEAAKRGVELFRILPGSALDEIVKTLPRTKEELTAIKGIKEAKYQLYGKTILSMVDEHFGATKVSKVLEDSGSEEMSRVGSFLQTNKQVENVFSVGTYLDIVNNSLWRLSARVKGEITSLKFQGSALYLSVKDPDDQSTMRVFMWLSDFESCGIEIREGLEVIVLGKSEIYKPTGGFSFRAQTIELVGEGALQAAYDALKKKLEAEGVFALERKRTLPEYPERIGLITSRDGAVIHDFLNNLGRFGFKIRFMDSRVEGVAAVKELLAAIAFMAKEEIDLLVIIRGGGSLESLQSFNNERVARAVASFPKPVICAIGHDKDVPLAQLAADYSPSTPTACTALLNTPWEEAKSRMRLMSQYLLSEGATLLRAADQELSSIRTILSEDLSLLRDIFSKASRAVVAYVPILARMLDTYEQMAKDAIRMLAVRYRSHLARIAETLKQFSAEITAHDPFRQLRLGYSIISQKGKVLHSISEMKIGQDFDARLADGTLKALVTEINPH